MTRAESTRGAGQDTEAREPIAIVGIGCRFPGGADSPEAFWKMLREGVDAVVEVPPDRWNADSFYDPHGARPGKAVTRWGGFLRQRIDEFDAQFFGMSPREAAHLDPMQRWLLEVTWEALEDAGLVPERLAGTPTGVFVGVFTEDTKLFQLSESNRDRIGPHTGTGTAMTMASNRLSYWFDFRGPSVSLDTACSSSLVAVHLACQSLRSGESTLALAGGVNAMFKPEFTIAESKAGMLSPDGRCKTFDARANGYVRGEGAGMVVLKPLSKAVADGDRIYALILGTAVNQDGRTNGITVPSGAAQEALMWEAFGRAGVSPGRVRYMEAHGTGTPVGDPIEAKALAAVLGADRPDGDRCLVGSVKTNIGHLEAAAGVAGLVKAALCLKHREIPPHLHLETPNPDIPFETTCLRVPRELEAWPAEPGPALAAVNSFGFGGTNAHAVLAAAPAEPAWSEHSTEGIPVQLVPLSARSPEALVDLARSYQSWLLEEAHTSSNLSDIAHGASVRRAHHDHRLALVAGSREEMAGCLAAFLAGEERPGLSRGTTVAGRRRRLAWVFTGMGPQWWGMGRQLLEQEPVFRATVEQCDALMRRFTDWSLLAEMTRDEAASRMAETRISQPANFALQVALAALLRSWGIEPDAIVGHSTGEVAAVHVAGVLSLEDAVRVIYHRSRLQHRTTGQGRLVAVGLTLEEAERAIAGLPGVSIAAVNGPAAVTLSGEAAMLDEVVRPLQERKVFCRFLRVDVPFHSHFMDPLQPELLEVLSGLDPRPAALPLYSTVTGSRIDGTELDAGYWWRNVREAVYFAPAVDALIRDGYDAFVEVGPHPVVSASISECLDQRGRSGVVLSTLRRQADERATLLGTLGALYVAGLSVDWRALHPQGRHLDLPHHPWRRERHWDESPQSAQDRLGKPAHPLLGRRTVTARPVWEAVLDRSVAPYLEDHRIEGALVYPGAAYVEMALAAGRELLGDSRALALEDVAFEKALFLAEDTSSTAQTLVDPESLRVEVCSRSSEDEVGWTRHATARLTALADLPPRNVSLDALRARLCEELPKEECYARLRRNGFHYGPAFQGLDRIWAGGCESLACVRAQEPVDLGAYGLHPAVLDACFQGLIVAAIARGDLATTYLPVGIERLAVHARPGRELWVHSRLSRLDERVLQGDIEVFDDTGCLVLDIRGVHGVSLEAEKGTGDQALEHLFCDLRWQPLDAPAAPTRTDDPSGTWIVLADRGGVGEDLASRLESHGEVCILVWPDTRFRASTDGRSFHIDPGKPQHFERLFVEALGKDGPPCRGLVHLWSLDAPPSDGLSGEALMAAQTPGPLAVIHAIQAFENSGRRDALRLWVVTRGAQGVGPGRPEVAVAQGPIWGLARTIFHQEHGDLAGGIVDLDPAAPQDRADGLFELLSSPRAGEDQFALRDGRALVPRLVPAPEWAAGSLPVRFRPDASYLITGGLGGLGLVFARWMVGRGARHLILVGRTPLPARSTWSAVEPGTPAAERIAAIGGLEALGASVHVASVDIADEARMAAFLEEFRREARPPIRGVMHAAGIVRPSFILEMSGEDFLSVLRPKLAGAWALHRLLAEEPLEFFVLFSSVAGLGFSMGMSNYAAGNAFLDGLAHHRRSRGLSALSVDWGSWGEVGMASTEDVARDFSYRGLIPILPETGLRGMERLFEHEPVQAAAILADWPTIDLRNYPMGAPLLLSPLMAQSRETAEIRPEIGVSEDVVARLATLSDPAQRREALESHLQDLVARVLRLERSRLTREQTLNALGLDSLLAVELRNRIESTLGPAPSIVELLQGGATVASLADTLEPRLGLDAAGHGSEVQDLVAELEQLSGQDVQALLDGARGLSAAGQA